MVTVYITSLVICLFLAIAGIYNIKTAVTPVIYNESHITSAIFVSIIPVANTMLALVVVYYTLEGLIKMVTSNKNA